LKACGVVTGAAGKRNPQRNPSLANSIGVSAKSIGRTRPRQGSIQVVVAPAKFIHQLSQPGRQLGFGANALLQPFADRIADGLAGSVIEWFDIAVDPGIHDNFLDEFHLAAVARFE
jgi:hypothetical protein